MMEYIGNLTRRCLRKVRETYSEICAVAPWFDRPLFLKKFSKALSIYIIIRHGFFSTLFFTVYHTLCRNKNQSPPHFNSETELLHATLKRFCFSFVIRCIVFWYMQSLSFPSLLLHTLIRVYVDPSGTLLRYLDNGLLLEERNRETNGIQKIGETADAMLKEESGVDLPDYSIQENVNQTGSEVVLFETSSNRQTSIVSHDNTTDNLQVEWLNTVIRKLWPHIGTYIEDLLMYKVLEELSISLKDKNLILGKIPPRVSSINIREEEEKMFIDIDVRYDGDCSAYVKWTPLELEIDHLQIDAQIQIELKNFVGMKPFIGEIVVHMAEPPMLDVRLKKIASIVEAFKPVKKSFLGFIQDKIQNVFPFSCPLIPDDV